MYTDSINGETFGGVPREIWREIGGDEFLGCCCCMNFKVLWTPLAEPRKGNPCGCFTESGLYLHIPELLRSVLEKISTSVILLCVVDNTWLSLLSSQCSASKSFFAPNFRQMSLVRPFLTTVMDHLKPSSRYFVWSLHVSGGQTLLLDFANEDCQNFGLCESWGTYTRQGIQSRRYSYWLIPNWKDSHHI